MPPVTGFDVGTGELPVEVDADASGDGEGLSPRAFSKFLGI
jgi:hypothetical protein